MLWRKSIGRPLAQPVPLPDPEQVRQAALQASWARDRRVARRRLAWRWALWYAWRYQWVLWLLGAVLAGAVAWHVHHRSADGLTAQAVPSRPSTALPATPQAQALASTSGAALPAPQPPAHAAWPAQAGTDPLPLRQADQLGSDSRATPSGRPAAQVPDPPPAPMTDLRFENWLHSKEI